MRALSALALALCGACGGTELADSPAEPSRSLTQSGPQDIAAFKRTLDAGDVPALSLLDEVAFLSEHALELPPADCGERICAHPMLAVAPSFDDGNWTMAFVAWNTAPAADAPPARRKHLLVITSGAVSASEVIDDWRSLLAPLAERLGPGDVVSVFVSGEAQLLAAGLQPQQLASLSFPPARGYDGEGLYAALAGALDLARQPRFADYAQAVVLLSEGMPPPRGVAPSKQEVGSPADFDALARRFAEQRLPITSIGLLHPAYTRRIPAALSEQSGGSYYVAADAAAAAEALAACAQTAFTPLASDLQLTLHAASGYTIGGVFGASPAQVSSDRASLSRPMLYAGTTQAGAGFFVQLVADEPGEETEADAFRLEVSYEDLTPGERKTAEFTLLTPLGVGQSPEPNAPFFSDPLRAKPFMVLNTYLALRTMLRLYAANGCGGARSVRDMLGQSHDYWQETYDDPDIAADFELVRRLSANIEAHCEQQPYEVATADLARF